MIPVVLSPDKLIIGARKTTLAQIQAREVASKISTVYPNIKIEFHFRETLGDVNQTAPLTGFDSRGVFTDDFYSMLVNKEIDLAVHSWKDLPIADRELTEIAGTTERADCRDVLLIKRSSIDKILSSSSISIFSSSPRREYNIGEFLNWALPGAPKSIFIPVRGNIETRLRKLIESDSDGLVVAKAALDRLLVGKYQEAESSRETVGKFVNECIPIVIPLTVCPAAPAQGALAIEIRRERPEIQNIISTINDASTFESVQAERKILAAYGGGCHQKIGATVLLKPYGKITYLRGLTDAGEKLDAVTLTRNSEPLPKAKSLENVWPKDIQDPSIEVFSRSPLSVTKPNPECGLWISKSEAVPSNWKIGPETPVWTAGLKTWKALAKKGIWVYGSSESLGEHEPPDVDLLLPKTKEWVKLSHDQSPEINANERLATYSLSVTKSFPVLKNITHSFWKSGSLFKAAVKANPNLLTGFHGCGPGNTFTIIKNILGNDERLRVYLSFKDFIKEVSP